MRRGAAPARVALALMAALAGGAGGSALAGAGVAAAAAPSGPLPLARLQGTFALHGRVTVARAVLGERAGQRIDRAWTFTPGCAGGPCATVVLTRPRAGGVDRLVLQRRTSTFYVGTGLFFVPVGCSGRVYPRGEVARYTVGVQVTAAGITPAGVVATAVRAFYRNPYRVNLTPCVAVPGHDAAVYTGDLAGAGGL